MRNLNDGNLDAGPVDRVFAAGEFQEDVHVVQCSARCLAVEWTAVTNLLGFGTEATLGVLRVEANNSAVD